LVSAGIAGGVHDNLFQEPPLCILNGFTSKNIPESQKKPIDLCSKAIKAVFPELDVTISSSAKVRRCVLFSLDSEYHIVMRQYAIHRVPMGVDPGLYNVLEKRRLSIGSLRSMEDLVQSADVSKANPAVAVAGSVADNAVTVGQNYIYLTEIGPRLRLELLKIEAGFLTGMVLYNSRVTKTAEEVAELEERARKNKHKLEREQKRAVQRAIQSHKAKARQQERLEEAHARAQEDLADYAELKKAELSESLGDSGDDFSPPPAGHKPSGRPVEAELREEEDAAWRQGTEKTRRPRKSERSRQSEKPRKPGKQGKQRPSEEEHEPRTKHEPHKGHKEHKEHRKHGARKL